MMRVILIAAVTLFAGLLFLLLLRHTKKQRQLLQNGISVTGTVESVAEQKQTGGNRYYAVTVSYCVNGKTYRHVHNDSLYTHFQTGQQTEVRYLAENPRYAYLAVQSCERLQNTPSVLFAVCSVLIVFLYLLILMPVLIPDDKLRRTVTDIFLYISMLAASFVMYLDERALCRMQDQVTGTVAYIEKKKRGYLAVAEYTVGGFTYRTRETRIPLMQPYLTGDSILVRYHPQKPYRSMIAEDKYALRYAKIMLVRWILEVVILSAIFLWL